MNLKEQRILFFTRSMNAGGTENVILQLCEIFKPMAEKIVVCSAGGVYTEKLDKMGIRHYEIPDIEMKSPTVIKQTIAILKKTVREERITVIHTHHRMAAFYVALLCLYKKCAFLNTSHNTFENRKGLTRFAYRHAHLIACGETVKKNLVQTFRLPDAQITVLHNAVKPFDGNIRKDKQLAGLKEEGYFLVGNIGRLSEQKGMEYFIEAIPLVLKHCARARFLIIGTGEEEEKLKKLAAALGIREVLSFMGFRPDIQNLMSQLDLVVLSSLWEGLPLTPIEAFSVGRTIVATDVEGTAEIVRDKENGLLVQKKSPEQMAEKIVWMIREKEERKKLEENAAETYQAEFSFACFAEKYITYYKEAINERA